MLTDSVPILPKTAQSTIILKIEYLQHLPNTRLQQFNSGCQLLISNNGCQLFFSYSMADRNIRHQLPLPNNMCQLY